MNKDEVLITVKSFLFDELKAGKVFGGRTNFMRNVLQKIENDIIKLEDDDQITTNHDDQCEIRHSIKILRDYICEYPITKEIKEFAFGWIQLVINWNLNTIKDDEITKDGQFIIRALDQHYTLIEATQMFKSINAKFHDLKSWNPPAFDLAKHYIDYLEK